ncbi:MAG: heme ABC transporter ATP-binding protein [Pyrinomonadaceae bacterium]
MDDVSFSVNPGEVLAVLGPNGAGKSTLLNALAGTVKTIRGEILFGGKELSRWKTDDLAKVRAVLPQNFDLDFPFKAREVALLGRTPHIRFSENARDFRIVEESLKKVEAEEFAGRFYPTLSGGERQRVQLARVLAQIWESQNGHSRYLLLDEPISGLDPAHQHLTLQTAREFAGRETAVVAVLHDMNLAAQYADKILILKNGKRFICDRPKNVFNSRVIREVFGIDAYVTKHAADYELPLIVPFGRAGGEGKTLGAKV